MAALPRSFDPDVSDTIMRFAVGYPRDRMKDMMTGVRRKDVIFRVSSKFLHPKLRDPRSLTDWSSTGTGYHLMCIHFESGPLPQTRYEDHPLSGTRYREYLRESHAQRLQWTCDACEPVDLELQRTHF